MEFVIDQLVTWWQFTVVGVLILIGWVANLFGIDNDKDGKIDGKSEIWSTSNSGTVISLNYRF